MGEKTKRTAKKSVFPSDAEWGMTMRDDRGLPQITRSNTDAMRRAWGRKHMFYVRNEGIYILSLVDLRKKRNLHLR